MLAYDSIPRPVESVQDFGPPRSSLHPHPASQHMDGGHTTLKSVLNPKSMCS